MTGNTLRRRAFENALQMAAGTICLYMRAFEDKACSRMIEDRWLTADSGFGRRSNLDHTALLLLLGHGRITFCIF